MKGLLYLAAPMLLAACSPTKECEEVRGEAYRIERILYSDPTDENAGVREAHTIRMPVERQESIDSLTQREKLLAEKVAAYADSSKPLAVTFPRTPEYIRLTKARDALIDEAAVLRVAAHELWKTGTRVYARVPIDAYTEGQTEYSLAEKSISCRVR